MKLKGRIWCDGIKQYTYFDTPYVTYDSDGKATIAFKYVSDVFLGGYGNNQIELFTNLSPDINGKEIYFGDKVKVIKDGDLPDDIKNETWIISDHNPSYIELVSLDGKSTIPWFQLEYICKLEVVGNIHQDNGSEK